MNESNGAKLRELDGRISCSNKELEKLREEIEKTIKKKNFVESSFLRDKETGKLLCIRLIFYSTLLSEWNSINEREGDPKKEITATIRKTPLPRKPDLMQARKILKDALKRTLEQFMGEHYKSYACRFKPIRLKHANIGLPLNSDDFFPNIDTNSKVSVNLVTKIWTDIKLDYLKEVDGMDEAVQYLMGFFEKEHNNIERQLARLRDKTSRIENEIKRFENEKRDIKKVEKAATQPGYHASEEESQWKKRDAVEELLNKLSKSEYEDIREKAVQLKERTDENSPLMESEAQSLKKTCILRNELKKRLDSEMEELKKKCVFVAAFANKLGVDNGFGKEFKDLADGFEAGFYKEGFDERRTVLREEADVFYAQISTLNRIGRRHKELELGTLKKAITEIMQKRNFDGMERLVRLLSWIIRYEQRIGREKLPTLMHMIGRKEYPHVIVAVNQCKNEGEKKNESDIEILKERLGFEFVPDQGVLLRIMNLHHSIEDGGLRILLSKGKIEYQNHNHTLSGARISLQRLGFKTQAIMAADKIQVYMDKKDRERLGQILALKELISKRNAGLQLTDA